MDLLKLHHFKVLELIMRKKSLISVLMNMMTVNAMVEFIMV
jgi:hypothetical protein